MTAPLRADTPEEADTLFPSRTALAFRPRASGRKQLLQLDLQRVRVAPSHQKGETSCLKAKHQTGLQVGFLGVPILVFICYPLHVESFNQEFEFGLRHSSQNLSVVDIK